MKSTFIAVLLCTALGAPMAATAGQQQELMKTCNADAKAKGLKGDERKSFMSSCLKGETAGGPSDKQKAQQEKMKTCNADAKAKGLKGDERKKFMSSCLSG